MVRVTLAGSPGRPPLGVGPWADAGAAIANARTPTIERRNNMMLLRVWDEPKEFGSDAGRRRILGEEESDEARRTDPRRRVR